MANQTISSRRGVAMFAVLFVMVVLGLMVVAFHQMGRQAQSTIHRFQTAEMARQLAAAAQEEAFEYLNRQTAEPYDNSWNVKPFSELIINRDSQIDMSSVGADNRKNVAGLELKIPATTALAESIMPGRMELSATARLVDYRTEDVDGNLFYGKECIGTIEIYVVVKPKEQYKKQYPGACTMIRHHEYKIASIISNKTDRENSYVGNSFLDYALFVRKGQDEFDTGSPNTTSINNEKCKLEIDAGTTPGKVNLGSSGNNYVYLNVSGSTQSMLPNGSSVTKIDGLEASNLEVDSFYPFFKKKLKQETEDKGADLEWVHGHKAIFYHQQLPVTDDGVASQDQKSNRLIAAANAVAMDKKQAVNGGETYFYDGIKIKPLDKLSEILESDVRKQFLNIGYFVLDLSGCEFKISAEGDSKTVSFASDAPEQVEQAKNTPIYIFDSTYHQGTLTGDLNLTTLTTFVKGKGEDIASKAFTYLNDEYAYGDGANAPLGNTGHFYKPSNSEAPSSVSAEDAHYPYSHYNLWIKRDLTKERFDKLGIYDPVNNKLHLRGIVHCENAIEIGKEGTDLEVDGRGVIIAPGIKINSGIKKKDDTAICVLFARNGPIVVNTDHEIQAGLMAMGRSVKNLGLQATQQLNLKGSLAVDYLYLNQWKEGANHTITYDDNFAPNKDIYSINIGRYTTFERVLEGE